VSGVDNLSFHSDARLFENIKVIALEKCLDLLLRHVGRHLGYEVDRYDFTLLIVMALELESEADDFGPFFTGERVGDLRQENAGLLPDLTIKYGTYRCELLMSFMSGSINRCW
jgi:hypothetical protein